MGLSRTCLHFKPPLLFTAGVILCIGLPMLPGSAGAQVVRGHLYDSETRRAVINGNVALRDSLGAVVARTGTDEEGAFMVNAPEPGLYSLLAVGLGYRSSPSGTFYLGAGEEVTVDLHLNPKPIEIPGFDVGPGTFQERLANVQAGLDLRLAEQPGESQVVEAERVRLYDGIHAQDPYRMLWRELRAGWDIDQEAVRIRGWWGNKVRPEVYLDDRRIFLLDFVLTPNSKLCRVEYYEPPPVYFDLPAELKFTMAPFQLRAYTCQFMAQVATGMRPMRKNLNWGDLIAGPGG